MHPFCLGLYFRNQLLKMKNYFLITISRVSAFIGEILSKICRGVLEKSRILYIKESILPHSNGIYYINSQVHLWTYAMKGIRPQHCPVSNNSFGSIWFSMVLVGHGFIVCPRSLFLCPFHKKLRIWWKKSFGFCQTDNPRSSFMMYCYSTDLNVYTWVELTYQNRQVFWIQFLT